MRRQDLKAARWQRQSGWESGVAGSAWLALHEVGRATLEPKLFALELKPWMRSSCSTATAIGRYRHTEAADGTSRKFSGMKSLKRMRWYAAVVLSVAATMLIWEDR